MKPLIYARKKSLVEAYEENRLRKSIKGSLEAVNLKYTTSVFDDYDLVHFINIEDINKVHDAKRGGYPVVISALYCETEKQSAMSHLKERKRTIKGKMKKCLNVADVVLVPGKKAKECLEKEGVSSRIEVFPLPINFKRFSPKFMENNQLFEKYFNAKSDEKFILCVGDYLNKVEMENLVEVAGLCYFVKFYFIGANYSPLLAKKYIRESSNNIVFSSLIPEDIYRSTLFKSQMMLKLDARNIEATHIMEAMAAKKQVIIYNAHAKKDSFLKDGENCYIRDGMYDLANCIEKYLKGKLADTTKVAYEFVHNRFNLESSGERLVRIYRSIL